MKAKDAWKRNPPVDPQKAFDNSILHAFRQGVTPEDMRKGVQKVCDKAREGDPEALRFLLSLFGKADVIAVARAMVERAKGGDTEAAALIFDAILTRQ